MRSMLRFFKTPALYIFASMSFLPKMTHAQGKCNQISSKASLTDYLEYPVCLINEYLIGGAIAVAILVFFIGILRYVMNGRCKKTS
jgi:hypothetical protein